MATKKEVKISPITRLNGPLGIDITIENGKVIDAKVKSLLFRGIEIMLRGRSPLDAVYITSRICGICSVAHTNAASRALEDALGIQPEKHDRMIRDFMHGAEYLQNHLRHIYQHVVVDYINAENIYSVAEVKNKFNRIPEKSSKRIAKHYFDSIENSRRAHEIVGELGGKTPHNHGMIPGGTNTEFTVSKFIKIKAILARIKEFVYSAMLSDLLEIGQYYPEYYEIGRGSGNLMSFGLFTEYEDSMKFLDAFATIDGEDVQFNERKITEEISHSWIKSDKEIYLPHEYVEEKYDYKKPSGYSWCRAPRYNGNAMEVGPLARCIRAGIYTRGISTMDRNIARVYEVMEIIKIMEEMMEALQNVETKKWSYNIPDEAVGKALVDTTRGTLGHWIEIRGGKIYNYSVITPSSWYLSPRDNNGELGVVEQALIGCEVEDTNNPVEIGRIVRSFDPCISCACHVTGGEKPITIKVV